MNRVISIVFLGRFTINNVAPGADGDSSKVKVKVRLNANGIFAVQSASMYESKQVTEDEQPEAMDTEEATGNAAEANGPKGDEAPAGDQPETGVSVYHILGERIIIIFYVSLQKTGNEGQDQQAEREKEAKASKSQKVKVKSVDLPIAAVVPEMTEKDLSAFRAAEVFLFSYVVLAGISCGFF